MLSPVQVRRRRIIGAVASLVGVLLVVLAIMGMTGQLGAGGKTTAANPNLGTTSGSQTSGASNSASQSASSDSASPSSGAAGDSSANKPDLKAPLTVLNGGGTAGLAGRARDAFAAKGWEVSEVGNYTGKKLPGSTIYYPADNPDAKQAATNLQSQFPKLTGLEQSPADLKFSGVVVILTGDWDPKNG
ncbi:LytR cell envelope-related transcriptional attenuator [Antricoccus suffuscus]|uniref:LytR cell envelope-related transcriptional attenuator n=1 Tax=Antricoccus suffuscus TaxID=1629062 RepID=A0A2T0ZKE0_9ACTN|nr:LytR C-terminal domain-containing protein [Antricoccus suffuscus]PRZ36608.1 LytR cell envelope-related transcriptional attenuator [Antricoccus suffuscus]